MNFKYLLTKKIHELVDSKEYNLPATVYDFYRNKYTGLNFNLKSVKDVQKETLCLKSVLDSIVWYDDSVVTIGKDDTYLPDGYTPRTFRQETQSHKYDFYNPEKLKYYLKFNEEELLSKTPKIILKLKSNGIHICDGYHRIFAAFKLKETLTFKCVIGKYK